MLSHIYNTAKRILSRSPSVQDRSSEPRDPPPTTRRLEVSMVTTRQGTETPGQDSAATPRSSARRNILKRELEALDTPAAAKRQRRCPPKKKADHVTAETVVAPDSSADDTSDTITVAVPQEQAPTQADKLPIRRRSSPQVLIARPSPASAKASEDAEEVVVEDAPVPTQETVFHTPNQKSDSIYETPATRSRPRASPTPKAKTTSERTSSAKNSSRRKTQMPSEAAEEAEGETTPTAAKVLDEIPSSTKKAHMRFSSEEPEDAQGSVLTNLQGHKRYEAPTTTQAEIADSDDDASDSDEAPEVVTTTAAASKAAASLQEAARAQRAQQEKERLKREAREQRIAAEQAEKRKREEKKARKLAKQLAKEAAATAAASVAEPSTQTATPAIDLAGLLPTSLLETIPDHRAPTPPLQSAGKSAKQVRQEKLNHHIKFLERTEKGVKDIKRGKLSVAVLGQQNKVLPPKVNRGSRDVRETWLKGRQVESRKGAKGKGGIGGKMERKEFGNKGFSRRGDD
ncbi:U3 snoRNA associated-domain-containing protein [Ampelomyces quisqualis]|uniref:U3 snoRNA associated-domain-containing protein n=1 Tax=Ampelomyces quisqualis TaxID=50730 RepID=A0A6A5QND9_AMPQU|nr:U3 snoRNA associated-domain-containing protein [Ampelomyces quisqualis]